MLIIPIIIFIITFILVIINKKFEALLFIIATKSIVDAFWSYKIGPFSPVSIHGILILFLFLTSFRINSKIFKNFWIVISLLLFFSYSISLIFSLFVSPVKFFENFVLSLIIFLSFYLLPQYVFDTNRLKNFSMP